jgi:Ribose/xylose/arabinose/galactoside ABC-type transport systems, permease components
MENNKTNNLLHNNSFATLIWPILGLTGILLFNLLFTHNFFRITIMDGHLYGSLIDIMNRAAPVMLLSIGMTLVIATAGVDISVGSVIAISGAIAATLIDLKAPMAIIVMAPLLASAILGTWNGFLVSTIGVQPIVASLILMVAGRGIAQLITDGQILVFENKAFEFIGNGFLFKLPFTITIVAVVFAITQFLTRKTALGLFIESAGCNPTASRYAGISVRTIKQVVYIFSGFCAGIAGLIAAANIKGADANNAGNGIELDAILAVVIGGTSMDGGKFSLTGSIIGALIMQALTTTILTRGIPVQVTRVVKALVVVAVILLQSETFRNSIKAKFRREVA